MATLSTLTGGTGARVALLAIGAVLAALSADCRREAAPRPSPPQPSQSPSTPTPPSAAAAPTSPAGVLSGTPGRRSPTPVLPPGKNLAWSVEQYGRPAEVTKHVVDLARAPFTLVVQLRGGIRDVFVSASFGPRTFDAARLGWPFPALNGIQGASRVDRPDDASNRLRDIYVNDDAPNQWLVCGPDAACSGFDGPCEPTADGVVCRRTVERAEIFARVGDKITADSRVDIATVTEPRLYLVFVVPGRWSEDERAGKLPYQTPELARDWGMIVWKASP